MCFASFAPFFLLIISSPASRLLRRSDLSLKCQDLESWLQVHYSLVMLPFQDDGNRKFPQKANLGDIAMSFGHFFWKFYEEISLHFSIKSSYFTLKSKNSFDLDFLLTHKYFFQRAGSQRRDQCPLGEHRSPSRNTKVAL